MQAVPANQTGSTGAAFFVREENNNKPKSGRVFYPDIIYPVSLCVIKVAAN